MTQSVISGTEAGSFRQEPVFRAVTLLQIVEINCVYLSINMYFTYYLTVMMILNVGVFLMYNNRIHRHIVYIKTNLTFNFLCRCRQQSSINFF